MSISEEFPNKFTEDGIEYGTIPGCQTITGTLNAFFALQDSDYIDHNGVLHSPEPPEGFFKADLIIWNATKENLVEWVQSLPETGRYKIAGVRVDV